jgi:penicillin-binding protein 2
MTGEPAYRRDDVVGRMGVERQYETVLRGRRGEAVEYTDRGGRLVTSYRSREPVAGRDVALTLDAALQRTAEELLQSALERRTITSGTMEPVGGAIVVMDVRDGAIRAAASAPAFDPNLFVSDKPVERAALLADKSHPLFDRVCRMAIPPGSTFKVLTAVALLESAAVGAQEPFHCQGYLHQPDRQRCQIYLRQGVGHGEVALADALAVSCNVYFFHFAGQMGPRPLVDWAERFGFGRPTGIDLPGEATGVLPCPENIRRLEGHAWRTDDTQSLAIGQGSLTATPLQVLCMMAAVANGGRLVTPQVVEREKRGQNYFPAEKSSDSLSPRAIPGLQRKTREAIRDGLRRAVADPEGTAHGTRASMDEYMDFPVKDRAGWNEVRKRYDPHTLVRYPKWWDQWVKLWKTADYPLEIGRAHV